MPVDGSDPAGRHLGVLHPDADSMHVTRGCVTSKTASPILLQLVDHDGALRATMATKVSLPIAVQVEPARRGRGEGAPGGVPQKSRSGGAQTRSGWRGDLQPLDACREFWRARQDLNPRPPGS